MVSDSGKIFLELGTSYSDLNSSLHLVRIQITFKTIRTPATKEFEQGKLEHKEDHLTMNCTQQIELIRYERIRTFGNLRNFYCLQDHTTSNNGERQGQGQRTS